VVLCSLTPQFFLQVETAKVEASNASQAATLKEEEAKVLEKEKEVQAVQAALDKQMRDVEKKGRELDALNRKYQKVMAAVPVGEDAGMHISIQKSECLALPAQLLPVLDNLTALPLDGCACSEPSPDRLICCSQKASACTLCRLCLLS